MAINYVSKRFLTAAILALFMIISTILFGQSVKAASINVINNSNWYDTDGNQIWAQGGWIMQEGSTFYWYGADYSVAGENKINLYTSTDMATWTNHGNVVDFSGFVDASGGYSGSDWVGRPVVKYNSLTSQYVMLIEWNNSVGIIRKGLTFLTSSSPAGPFIFNNNDPLPSGNTMGDLGSIFEDDDGSTYISFTSDYNYINGALRISKLSDDYLSIVENTKLLVSTGPYKEATTLIKRGSKYIMLASTTNGWQSSPTWCYSATSLSGTWSTPYQCAMSPSSTNSFDTQTDQVLPIQGTAGTMYMYIGDRWNNKPDGSTGIGRNQWYPLTFDSNGMPIINGYAQWSLDAAAGTWSPSSAGIDVTQNYSITNRSSGKALGIVGNSTADSAMVEQRTLTGAAGQSWQFVDTGDGYFKIKNVNSGKFMNISGASTAEGAQAIQYTSSTSTNQQWQLISVGDGYYKIKNRNSGKVLSVSGSSGADGALIVQGADANAWSQNFKFDKFAPVDVAKTYSIINRNSGKALGVSGNSTADGATIVQNVYGTAVSQSWQFIDAGTGYFKIKNVNSGKVMDINGASSTDGAQNIQWTDNGGTNQKWQLIDAGGGYYKIKNVNSGKVLGMSGGTTADGGACIQWSETGSLNQNWSFNVLAP